MNSSLWNEVDTKVSSFSNICDRSRGFKDLEREGAGGGKPGGGRGRWRNLEGEGAGRGKMEGEGGMWG